MIRNTIIHSIIDFLTPTIYYIIWSVYLISCVLMIFVIISSSSNSKEDTLFMNVVMVLTSPVIWFILLILVVRNIKTWDLNRI